MIDKKSLFSLNYSTLQTKLSKDWHITSKSLLQEPELFFYVSKTDPRDYYFFNFSCPKDGYFEDFLVLSALDSTPTIEDIIFYIKEDLKKLYFDSLKVDNKIVQLEQKNKALETEIQGLIKKLNLIKSIA